MSEPALPEKILAVHDSLTRAEIAHAFGGALTLAYYAEPRATDDIDVNVFVTPAAFPAHPRRARPRTQRFDHTVDALLGDEP